MGAAGGAAMLSHVSLTSTSLGAFLTGNGSWAGLSVGATAGLSTAGILFLAAATGFAGYKVFSWVNHKGHQYSEEMTAEIINAMTNVSEAHGACRNHVTRLGNIKG